ncbi:MAG: hypothetical protein IKI86_07960 [Firmicutes bacterium]|nr:hypothetical protein [Bacillota bacterium]
MKLGYDLTIEQTQKLTMTPELIQAIQILQYNSQELEEFVSKDAACLVGGVLVCIYICYRKGKEK